MKTKYWLLLFLIGIFIWFRFIKERDYSPTYTDAIKLTVERERKIQEEEKHKQYIDYEKYKNNSLKTGEMPYFNCFISLSFCENNCSKIEVTAPVGSDVLVSVKKEGQVYKHVYIRAEENFTFTLPNGSYQTFFYYGNGWNPNKSIKETSCKMLKGGFVRNQVVGKDEPQFLKNKLLTYKLVLHKNENFPNELSNIKEAF